AGLRALRGHPRRAARRLPPPRGPVGPRFGDRHGALLGGRGRSRGRARGLSELATLPGMNTGTPSMPDAARPSLLRRLGTFCYRRHRLVVGLWVVALV